MSEKQDPAKLLITNADLNFSAATIQRDGSSASLELLHTPFGWGVDSQLRRETSPCNIPATSLIGRMFTQRLSPVLSLVNPIILESDDGQTSQSSELLPELLGNTDSIRILNAGCGGAGDVPLLQSLMRDRLDELGFQSASVEIVNIDQSAPIVELVQRAEFPHCAPLRESPSRDGIRDVNVRERLSRYLRSAFDPIELSADDGETLHGYRMKPEHARSINVRQGDILKLREPRGSYDCIICLNVALHLTQQEKIRALKQMCNSLRVGGYLLSDGIIYQKTDNKLLTCRTTRGSGLPQIFPTCFDGESYQPYDIRTARLAREMIMQPADYEMFNTQAADACNRGLEGKRRNK